MRKSLMVALIAALLLACSATVLAGPGPGGTGGTPDPVVVIGGPK